MQVLEPYSDSALKEIFNRHFKELKHCPPADVSKHIVAILECFPFIAGAAREEHADAVYELAIQHKAEKPLLFAYANLVRAFNYFYSENYNKALPMLPETQKLFEEQGDSNGAALCILISGSIY